MWLSGVLWALCSHCTHCAKAILCLPWNVPFSAGAQQPFSTSEQQPGVFGDTKRREKNPLQWVGAAGRAEPASISPMLSVKQVPYYSINPCDLLVPASWMYAESIQCWFTDILPGLNNCKAHQHHMKNAICKKPFSSAEMGVSGSIPFLQTSSGNISFAYDINCRRNRHAPSHLIHTVFYVLFSYKSKELGWIV